MALFVVLDGDVAEAGGGEVALQLVGGDEFEFFNAIFNVADSAITVGIAILIVYYLVQEHKKKKVPQTEESSKEME